jgi:hypothetical protein
MSNTTRVPGVNETDPLLLKEAIPLEVRSDGQPLAWPASFIVQPNPFCK